MEPGLDLLQKKIDVFFKRPELLEMAMMHPSYLSEHPEIEQNNQRLEFLGDAILGAVVALYIYQHYPEAAEGELTKIRAAVVCESSLANLAMRLNLGEYIRLGRGEILSGGKKRASILADAFEAVIAAVFIDQGWQKTCDFLWVLFRDEIQKSVMGMTRDYKTFLQEEVQKQGNSNLFYQLLSEEGPDHDKQFTSGVYLNKKLLGSGSGKSKKEAEQQAAKKAIEVLNKKL